MRASRSDNVDPRAILDQVKRTQPSMNGPEYGSMFSNSFQQDYASNLPLAYPTSDFDVQSQAAGSEGSLRNSFSRILNVRQQQYSAEPLPTPFSYARSTRQSEICDMRSEISFSSASDM